MEALRKIIDSDELQKIMSLPDSFKHRKLELVVLPAGDISSNSDVGKNARGFLSQYKNPDLIEAESEIWEKVVTEKYGDS